MKLCLLKKEARQKAVEHGHSLTGWEPTVPNTEAKATCISCGGEAIVRRSSIYLNNVIYGPAIDFTCELVRSTKTASPDAI